MDRCRAGRSIRPQSILRHQRVLAAAKTWWSVPTSFSKDVVLAGTQLKAFVGAKDFATSKAFYVAMGFTARWETETLVEFALGECRFLLQDFYDQGWCENTMLHLTVNDAAAWHTHLAQLLATSAFGAARIAPPKQEDYGAKVTYCWDPSGVLWHLAQYDVV